MNQPGKFQILSLDGGGIRGLYSAAILAKWEEDLHCSIADHFDLIVGTSTGGIIALGLGLGLKPREIVQFYLTKGAQIFPNGWIPGYRGLRQYFANKFSAKPLEASLKDCFGDKVLGNSAKRLIVPSFDLGQTSVSPHY
jgi:patatin-like phospholipase/acyl hydrolase